MKWCLSWIVLCLGCSLVSPKLHAQKIAKDLLTADGLANVDVIVQWKSTPDAAKHQKFIDRGGLLRTVHSSIKASSYTIQAAALSQLANDPDVAFISPDRPLTSKLDLTAAAINAGVAWGQSFTGVGIGVAVIDSGMNASPNLTLHNNIVYNQDFTGQYKPNANVQDTHNAPDTFGHGQHVAGIIASSGVSSSCGNCTRILKGIAPGVNLINLRALDENGKGTDTAVIAAIDRAIQLKDVYNIRVLNLSLGRPVYESYLLDPLCQAVEAAWKAGIVVVVAAGNEGRDNSFDNQGYGTINAPGNDPYVITVGAMKTEGTPNRNDDLIASYSSKGPTQIDHIVKPDLVAPGNMIVSLLASPNATLVTANPSNAVPFSFYQAPNNQHASNVYFTLSGTSMAAPVVSGAVADLLQAKPSLTPDQAKALIMQTAGKSFPSFSTATDPVTGVSYLSYYDLFTVGAGYLDLGAALQNINSVPAGTVALSSTAFYDESTGAVDLSGPTSNIWASRAVWGARSVWGSSSLSDSRCVWGARSVWGSSSNTFANRAVWGASSVWSASNDSAASSSVTVHGEQ